MDREALHQSQNYLRSGESDQEKLNQILGRFTPEELESDEPIECLSVQRQFIEAAFQRAANIVDKPDAYFPNPHDRETHIQFRASQEIAMAFCAVRGPLGEQLANTVDGLAKRCLDAEAGSRKQSQLIEEQKEQIDHLTSLLHDGGASRGNRSR